jgi:opacity protein-like surface antigen
MKKAIIFCSVFMLSILSVKADLNDTPGPPAGYIGVRFMPVFTTLKFKKLNNEVVTGNVQFGQGYGALLGINFSEHWGLQLEGIYNRLSQKYTDIDIERTVHVSYINVPLLLSFNTNYRMPVNLNIVAGPQLGINVASDFSNSGGSDIDSLQAVLAVKKSDVGVAFGAGLDFALGAMVRLSLGYRGVVGLLNISDTNTSITTNQYYILEKSQHATTHAAYIGLTFIF